MDCYIDETTKEDFTEDTAIREAIDNIYDMLADLPKKNVLLSLSKFQNQKI